jgi:hypothetical protein
MKPVENISVSVGCWPSKQYDSIYLLGSWYTHNPEALCALGFRKDPEKPDETIWSAVVHWTITDHNCLMTKGTSTRKVCALLTKHERALPPM